MVAGAGVQGQYGDETGAQVIRVGRKRQGRKAIFFRKEQRGKRSNQKKNKKKKKQG